LSKPKVDWKASYHVMRNALDKELETNGAHTAEIVRLKKIINDQESAFRGQEAAIRQLKTEADRDARLIADKINVIKNHDRRIMELAEDARCANEQCTILQAKYDAATNIIAIITGKAPF